MFYLPIDPSSVYFIPIVVTLFLVFIIGVFWINLLIFSKLSERVKKTEKLTQEETYQEALSVLEDAKNRSFGILQDANIKAQKMLEKAGTFSEDTRTALEDQIKHLNEKQSNTLEEMSHELLGFYKNAIEDEKEGSIQIIKDVSEDLKKEAVSELVEFKDVLHKETIESQELVRKKVNLEYEQMEKELEKYKEVKLKEIDGAIYHILADVTRNVLGKALSLEDHQELVMSSLEEARRQGGSLENG
jgi:hypothetical protein